MITVNEFLDLTEDKNKKSINVKFATISSNYVSGRPTVVLDGSTSETIKKYPYLSRYQPKANDRVMIINNVIVDKIV